MGIISIFFAWALGQYLGALFWPNSMLVGGREALSAKIGSSVLVLISALLIRRYVLRSLCSMLVCLGLLELIVLVVVFCVSGLGPVSWSALNFAGWWLYALTWNVIVCSVLGAIIGQIWEHASVNNLPLSP